MPLNSAEKLRSARALSFPGTFVKLCALATRHPAPPNPKAPIWIWAPPSFNLTGLACPRAPPASKGSPGSQAPLPQPRAGCPLHLRWPPLCTLPAFSSGEVRNTDYTKHVSNAGNELFLGLGPQASTLLLLLEKYDPNCAYRGDILWFNSKHRGFSGQ